MRSMVAWHPDARASVALAVAATLLVMTCFAALFLTAPKLKLSHETVAVTEQLVLSEPAALSPTRRPHRRTRAPLPELPLLQNAWPPVLPLVAAPHPFTSQNYLDERKQQAAAALRDKVTAGDLQRHIGEITQSPALPDNQSYQTVDGQKIVRNGGGCAQIQTVHGSSSPINRIDIAEPTDCPGGAHDASRDMGKALDDWASQQHRSQPPSVEGRG